MSAAKEGSVVKTVRIVNPEGLHARPCHSVVSLAREFDAELRIANGAHSVNGRSILELMTLAASLGTELELSASGDDASALVEALCELISAGFTEND